MKLNELQPNEGSKKDRMRVGRGIGSGKGKTCGSGQKGQKSRTGVAIKGFEGGQMPLYRRLPKSGFVSRNRKNYALVTLARLQQAVDAKKLDAKKAVDEKTLLEAGIVRRIKDGVSIVATGELKTKLDLSVTRASKSAVTAIEKAGGKITLTLSEKK